jgi:dienelactone hydrolase
MMRCLLSFLAICSSVAAEPPFSRIPEQWREQRSTLRSPLLQPNGERISTAAAWREERRKIEARWHELMGQWPPVIQQPKLSVLETSEREGITQQKVSVEIALGQMATGYLLLPDPSARRSCPAVFVPFYDAETSIGIGSKPQRDFAWQLARQGYVALAIGSPGGDARKPELAENAVHLQPLSYLGYISANAWQALAQLPQVDALRIAVVGHSYGGKWAMLGSCLYEKYAAAVWSDPGIVFGEERQSINYQEPWYLGYDPKLTRQPGLVRPDSPRTGAYRLMVERGMNLHELHALMAPRPFLVSGGAEDPERRWLDLRPTLEVYDLLGKPGRVAMTNRPLHEPNAESNAQIVQFLLHWLGGKHGPGALAQSLLE